MALKKVNTVAVIFLGLVDSGFVPVHWSDANVTLSILERRVGVNSQLSAAGVFLKSIMN